MIVPTVTVGDALPDGRVVHRIIDMPNGRLLCVHNPTPNSHGRLDKSTVRVDRNGAVIR